MEQLDLQTFYDDYINEMIQAEIELEKKVFYDNLPMAERLQLELIKDLSENLAKEIDKEIIKHLYDLADLKIRMSETAIYVDAVLNPIVEVEHINLNLTITPEGATFDS